MIEIKEIYTQTNEKGEELYKIVFRKREFVLLTKGEQINENLKSRNLVSSEKRTLLYADEYIPNDPIDVCSKMYKILGKTLKGSLADAWTYLVYNKIVRLDQK